MKIVDQTSKKIITNKGQVAKKITDKILGLLNPRNSRFLIINTRFGIHTYFINKRIDIILLNKNNTVVRLLCNFPPNKFLFYHPKITTVIELPMGTIKDRAVQLNDKISIE